MPSIQYKLFSRIIKLVPLKARLNILYFRRFRSLPNLVKPIKFNEKVQVKKLTDRSEILTVSADKLKSKEFVKGLVDELYIPRTIWEGSSVKDIERLNLDSLPDDYVFKANHTSQTIEIIRDGKHLEKKKMKCLCQKWLSHDQSGTLGEWAYQDIPKRVFIEEFLDFNGRVPDDYKFFVYHGKVHFIQLDTGRFIDHKRNMFDRNWNDLGFDYSYHRMIPSPERPKFLEQMISVAESIGKEFDFIRVDLYYYNNKVTFGELTVYPGAGFEKFPDEKFDLLFGKPW